MKTAAHPSLADIKQVLRDMPNTGMDDWQFVFVADVSKIGARTGVAMYSIAGVPGIKYEDEAAAAIWKKIYGCL